VIPRPNNSVSNPCADRGSSMSMESAGSNSLSRRYLPSLVRARPVGCFPHGATFRAGFPKAAWQKPHALQVSRTPSGSHLPQAVRSGWLGGGPDARRQASFVDAHARRWAVLHAYRASATRIAGTERACKAKSQPTGALRRAPGAPISSPLPGRLLRLICLYLIYSPISSVFRLSAGNDP
jgi:hypothetical protein